MSSHTDRVRVSTIIPTYNCARYISDAVESVLAQTCAPCEIIIVDDGSTDGTCQVLDPYRDRVQYVYQKNRGEPAARNTGLRIAKGDLIAFLDADDLWMPEKLEVQTKHLAVHPDCSLVYSDMAIFDDNGMIHESVKAWLGMSPPSGDVFLRLFQETLFCPGAVVFRKECINKVGLFDEAFLVGCDYEMWLRMARHFKFGYVDRPLLMYRQHAAQATRRGVEDLPDGVPWELRVLDKILRLYPETTAELGRFKVRQRFSRPYFFLGSTEFDLGRHREARRLFFRALRLWPTNWHYQMRFLATLLAPSQASKLRSLYHSFASTDSHDE